MAIQADGKILVAGVGMRNFAVARYNSNGTLDTSFDGDGKLTTDFGGSDYVSGMAIQADGKIVVAGGSNSDFAVARYNSNGTLDTSFDGDGKLTTDFRGYDLANTMAIQADGKILVAGGSDSDFAVARYNSNGTLDTSFDGDGKLRINFSDGYDFANSMAIQTDGRIVLAGTNSRDFALARLNNGIETDSQVAGMNPPDQDMAGVLGIDPNPLTASNSSSIL